MRPGANNLWGSRGELGHCEWSHVKPQCPQRDSAGFESGAWRQVLGRRAREDRNCEWDESKTDTAHGAGRCIADVISTPVGVARQTFYLTLFRYLEEWPEFLTWPDADDLFISYPDSIEQLPG